MIKNTKIFLDIEDEIYYPFDKQDDNYSYIISKDGFLSGVTGAGMVLQSIYYTNFDWSPPLLIY